MNAFRTIFHGKKFGNMTGIQQNLGSCPLNFAKPIFRSFIHGSIAEMIKEKRA
jgi:hypothetical protein